MNSDISALVCQTAKQLREELSFATIHLTEQERFAAIAVAMDRCLESLASTGLAGPDNRLPSSELWNIAGDLLETGWLQNHARAKPRGYAGDFEMLAWIGDSRTCEHPLGRYFDRYFQSQAAPQAVRNRIEIAAATICSQVRRSVDQEVSRIVVVGCGPALDVVQAAQQLTEDERRRLHVTLLDLDPHALAFAHERLSPLLSEQQLCLENVNLFRLASKPSTTRLLAQSSLTICTGLFDYLDDSSAAAMLRGFWRDLAPQGQLLVFNFAPENPSRAYMEWIGNWYLIYRSRVSLGNLALMSGIPVDCVTLGSEAQGIGLYLVAIKSEPRKSELNPDCYT